MAERIFVRNNRPKAELDDADESNLDVLVVVGDSRFALFHFTNDEVGTATDDPRGPGCGISFGSVGRVGNVLTVEQFLVFGTVTHPPMRPGKAAGILLVGRDSATLEGSMMDGTYADIGRQRLPQGWTHFDFRFFFFPHCLLALSQYTDQLAETDRAFRINFPF